MLDSCSKCGDLVDIDGYDPKVHGPILCGNDRCIRTPELEIEGGEQKLIHPPTRKAFSSSIFLFNKGRFLLVFHKRFQMWLPVGGELKKGETPQECAIRETLEETGLQLRQKDFWPVSMPGQPRGFVGYEEHDAGEKGIHMNFVFVAHTRTREVVLCDEHTAFYWIDPGDDHRGNADLNNLKMPNNVDWCLRTLRR